MFLPVGPTVDNTKNIDRVLALYLLIDTCIDANKLGPNQGRQTA